MTELEATFPAGTAIIAPTGERLTVTGHNFDNKYFPYFITDAGWFRVEDCTVPGTGCQTIYRTGGYVSMAGTYVPYREEQCDEPAPYRTRLGQRQCALCRSL